MSPVIRVQHKSLNRKCSLVVTYIFHNNFGLQVQWKLLKVGKFFVDTLEAYSDHY